MAKVMILSGFPSIYRFGISMIVFGLGISIQVFPQNERLESNWSVRFFQIGAESVQWQKQGISEREFLKNLQYWNRQYYNGGFPFAISRIDTLKEGDKVKVVVSTDPGPAIFNGSIVQEVDTVFNPKMLARWFRFREGQPFSLGKFEKIKILERQLPMAEIIGPTSLEWYGEKAILHLYLRKKKNNSFSGLLGILPQGEGEKPIVTGNIDASLQNLFGVGLALEVKWNRFASSSQTANLKVLQEALGYNGLAAEALFELFRQDSVLSRQRLEFRLITTPTGFWKYKIGFQAIAASSNFGADIASSQKISTQALTLTLAYEPEASTGILLYPRHFSLGLKPGLKKAEQSGVSRNFSQLEGLCLFTFPLVKFNNRFVLQTAGQVAGVFCEQILIPDQFRMGGFQNLRGFNENQFFTSQHGLVGLQPRYLIDRSMLVHAFAQTMAFNSGLSSNPFPNLQWAHSMGLGVELEIGNNLIQLTLANGFANQIPIDFQSAKIHFGYVARF